jgi:hypothetical protein
MEKIDEAIRIDNEDYTASNEQLTYIENLLQTSTYDERQRSAIEMEISVMNAQRASKVINQLLENQLGPDHGNMGTQRQLSKHIQNISQ